MKKRSLISLILAMTVAVGTVGITGCQSKKKTETASKQTQSDDLHFARYDDCGEKL